MTHNNYYERFSEAPDKVGHTTIQGKTTTKAQNVFFPL